MSCEAADLTPRIDVNDRHILGTIFHEVIVELKCVGRWLVPCLLWVAEEHSQQMARIRTDSVSETVRRTSMKNGEVVDELNVTVLAIKLHLHALGGVFNNAKSVKLLVCKSWHA